MKCPQLKIWTKGVWLVSMAQLVVDAVTTKPDSKKVIVNVKFFVKTSKTKDALTNRNVLAIANQRQVFFLII